MTSQIKLYGSKAERFETIKDDLVDLLGYEPSNPEVVGILMANYAGNGSGDIPTPKNYRRG